MSGNRISSNQRRISVDTGADAPNTGAVALDCYRKLQARMLLPGYMVVGIATGGSVPKGPKPLRYGPEVVGESIAPKDWTDEPTTVNIQKNRLALPAH